MLLHIFSSYLKEDARAFAVFEQISRILLILTIGWLVIQVIRAMLHFWQKKFDLQNPNNLESRKRLTQMSMLERIAVILVGFIFISIALMTIDSVRQLGVSLLASAGGCRNHCRFCCPTQLRTDFLRHPDCFYTTHPVRRCGGD